VISLSKDKNTLKIIDETLRSVESNFKQFIDVLKTAKNQLIELEKDKLQLSKEKDILENDKAKLEEEKLGLEAEKSQLEQEKIKLEEDTRQLEKEKQERDQKIGALTEEQMKLLDEYEKVKVELKKLAEIAEERESSEFNFEKIQALLSIYRVLLEEIWQGQPHFRILLALHGEKEEMTREEIKNTTGISGAMVLRALHELDKANILEFNENTDMIQLKRRLFDKKALEEK
jgi:chromosome segregation ATPase